MNPNPNLSFDDKSRSITYADQFMPHQASQPMPKFEDFMKACISNPSFFQTMKVYYDLQQGNGKAQMSGLEMSSQFSSAELGRGSPSDNYEQNRNYNDPKMARLPANPLLKYQPPQASTSQASRQRENLIGQDQVSIKSNYIEKISGNGNKFSPNLSSLKENQSINIDIEERPAKVGKQQKVVGVPAKVDNPSLKYRQFEERPIKSMSKEEQAENYQEMDKKLSKQPVTTQNSSALAGDDRPLTGAKKDFKELIKEQFPQALPLEQEEEKEERHVQPRNFLKRGSRQHLSSAVNRSKQPNNKEEDALNKSGLDKSRDITPKHLKTEKRSISQNRVLGKKPAENNNDKSINKGISKHQEQPQIPKSRPPMQNKLKEEIPSKTKIEVKASEVKKKKKNVFADNSSESSSSSGDEPFFRANVDKSEIKDDNEGKIEVIASVFLTNQQLEQILQKYGKTVKPAPKESESEKIQSIRNKYTELCHLVESQREAHQAELQKQKQQFEKYKADQMNKIKNERRVMERQLKSGSSNQNLQKEKEEMQALKLEVQRQREQFKKKDRNNKIMIDKYKKEIEELKAKVERLEMEKDQPSTKKTINNFIQQNNLDQKITVSRGITSKPKIEEDFAKEQVSIKDLKKGKDAKQPSKLKYDYSEEEPVGKGKVTNVQKEEKIENKWMTNKINANINIESSSESQGEEAAEAENSSFPEWSPTMKLSDLTKIDLSIKMVNEKMINALFKYQNNIEYRKYMQTVNSPSRTIVNTTRNTKNNFVTNLYNDRSKELVYDNGTKKVTLQSGFTIVYFKNGDIKQTLPDRTVLYFFKEKDVDQITLSNGVNIYRFENNQVEFHFDKDHIEIRHADGTFKVTGPILHR